MLRRTLVSLFLFAAYLLTLQPRPTFAIYDALSVPNNLYGIHILETSELERAAELVNSSSGDWGYVTIPIRANERNLPKWTKFMQDCQKLHLIPILRIASFPVDDHWMAPNEYDLLDFANFLNELPWPTKNRYVIIYNEPNHKNEWGGFVYPEEYAKVLDRAIDIFHRINPNFFVISAGFDSSAPNGPDSLNEYSYLQIMNTAVPGIFLKIDGFSSHSYGNPAFSSFPNTTSPVNIANYRFEENYLRTLGVGDVKLFITEAGWRQDIIGEKGMTKFYKTAFNDIWTDKNIVAITPFVLSAQAGPFSTFSFIDGSGNFQPFAKEIQTFSKTKGAPQLEIRTNNAPSLVNLINAGPNNQNNSKITILDLWQKFLSLFKL